MDGSEQHEALLDLLNSTPVVNGAVEDQLTDPDAARAWQLAHGGDGSPHERRSLIRARDGLQDVIRGDRPSDSLSALLKGVVSRPLVSAEGVSWQVEVPDERRLAVEAVLAWSAVHETMPGRLRPCANPECRLFLLDRSKGNKARWCSMAVCGNRMKVRRHYQRAREAAQEQTPDA
ncbi:CGNR zinc finger domain-containing protein [Streptacidiphilus fuscans]|uniref:CGNR zinc finger domain-containing protein n=1 Tax=Streptacidiphilus fuscans TaxID=2789292 RepID=A0A931B3F2_9ACTN|nr:CGNR zinc finger domain-containing protein [Streptacidiphilus fuscans]MBF9067238.1 CGNR zinc finger domain-containing protein [Streptacidiphilus fuscans]